MSKNIVRARVTVVGNRPLLQHAFGPESIALEKAEKAGVAGNDPTEWRRTCLVTEDGQLFIRHTYAFRAIVNGAKNMKKGRGTMQPFVACTLRVEERVILLDRFVPKEGDPPLDTTDGGLGHDVYVDVCGVKNPATKGRNVRYRLACSPGWKCSFPIAFDKTIVARAQMQSIIIDAGRFAGLGDGLTIGYGRFDVEKYEELTDAEESPAEGSVAQEPPADRVASRRRKVPAVPGNGAV